MKITHANSYSGFVLGMGALVSAMLYVYALSYPPFVFNSYLPNEARIGIEGFTLLLLLLIILYYGYAIREVIWLLLYFATLSCTLLLGMDLFVKIISSFNKIVFLILLISILRRNPRILGNCMDIWITLWFVLSAMAIFAFVGYVSKIVPFSTVNFSESLGGPPGAAYFLSNPLLGNLIPRVLFGMNLGRVSGFMYEGGMLAYFFGFNILVARDWIKEKRRASRFIWFNLMAGITTLSTTFYLLIAAYFLAKSILDSRKSKFSIWMMILLPFVVLFFMFLPYLGVLLLEQSSGNVRISSYLIYLKMLEDNTWLTWLLGNGVGIAGDETWGLGGFDSGWVAILIERGCIMLVLIAYLFSKYTKYNRWLTGYVVFYHFAFYLFWDPIFLLGIAMHFAYFSYRRKRKSGMVPSEAANRYAPGLA